MNNEQRKTAIEEVKILSSTIGRTERAIYQKQAWLFTLITGLILALLKEKALICKIQFLEISALITVLFYFAELFQRVVTHRAIERSEEVETALGSGTEYGGPLVSYSLTSKKKCSCDDITDIYKFFWKPRIIVPYLLAGLIIYIVYHIAPR